MMKTILGLHQQFSRFDANLTEWGGSVLNLALRFYVGSQFFKAGMLKVADWATTLALFHDEYKVPVLPPELAAWMGAGGELLFPVLLFAGLFTRQAALGLLAVNVMAVISYPVLFSYDCPAALNDHLYWGLLLLVLAAFGPGRFSVDEVIEEKRAGK